MPKNTNRTTNQKNMVLTEAEWAILDYFKLKTGKTHSWIIRDLIYRAGKGASNSTYILKKHIAEIERMREIDRKRSFQKKTVKQQKKARDLQDLLRISRDYNIRLPEDYDTYFFF